jgi:hypothetical protein
MTIKVIDEASFDILNSIEKITGKPVNTLINEAVKSYVTEVPELRQKVTDHAKAIDMLLGKINNNPISENAEQLHKDYHNAKLFEIIMIEGHEFLRVPGGWVASKSNGAGICFVPMSDEYEDEY